MTAQNETGKIFNIHEIARLCRTKHPDVLIHTDAAQGIGKCSCTLFGASGKDVNGDADMITVVGHKIGAPKGVGCLIIGDKVGGRLTQVGEKARGGVGMVGGGQMCGIRGGTENVCYIEAVGRAVDEMGGWRDRMRSGKVELVEALRERIGGDEVVFNCGSDVGGGEGTVSVGFPGCGMCSREIVRKCADKGLYVAAGSACDSGKEEGSYGGVLEKSGVEERVGRTTVRVSTGWWVEEGDGNWNPPISHFAAL